MMARDAIGLKCITAEDENRELKMPSKVSNIDVTKGTFYCEEGQSLVSIVDVDLAYYRRKMDNKTVRRNVTLPNWLNEEAEKAHINVSKVLREALTMKLGF